MTVKQFIMLRFMGRNFWSDDRALLFRQRTFGSLCSHGWVNYDARREAFYVTRLGREMLRASANTTQLMRIDNSQLDWGLQTASIMYQQTKIHVVKKRRAA